MNFPANEILQWITANWHWILLGWVGASLILTPIISRFAATNTIMEERAVLRHTQAPDLDPPRLISFDDPDWKDQIESIYHDHGGEG